MLLKVIIVLVLIIVGFLIYVAFQPSDFSIAREMLVKANPEAIFPFINNSQKTNEWMPWRDVDPGAQMNYSGPAEGVGATCSWDSKGQMGKGQAVVVESISNQVVKTQLTYTRPMQMSQLAEVKLTPTANGTLVRWSVTGQNSFMGRLMCVFMNMDKMVGGEFEKGLTNLKRLVEGSQG